METNSSYWLSYSHHEAPSAYQQLEGIGCVVSIVLEESAKFYYSTLRLLVVYPGQKSGAPRLCLTNGPDQGAYLHAQSLSDTRSRSHLSHLRAARQKVEERGPLESSQLAVCNVILSVFKVHEGSIMLAPHLGLSEPSQFCVVYEYTCPVDPENPALHLSIYSRNHCFTPAPPRLCCTLDPQPIPAYGIHILPVTNRRHTWSSLQPDIIYTIVDLAIGIKPAGWRRALLAYGLVCRSWTHVLSLLFSRFYGKYEQYDIINIAQLLRKNPEHGMLMNRFSIWDFQDPTNSHTTDYTSSDIWDALTDILRYATSVTSVDLPLIPRPFVHRLMLTLANLCHVKFCCILGAFTMNEIQKVLSSWVCLDVLEVENWESKECGSEIPPTDYRAMKLKMLTLTKGMIYGPQLCRFASPDQCALTKLTLQRVSGLSNNDLYIFLSSIAATLKSLVLRNSKFSHSPQEELALDRVISELEHLKSLSCEGDHLSFLTLTRKIPLRYSSSTDFVEIWLNTAEECISLNAIAMAILDYGVIGWRAVIISKCPRDALDDERDNMERAIITAEKQGVMIEVEFE